MKILLSVISLIIISSCSSKLVFENPIPKNGQKVTDLPAHLEGIYFTGEDRNFQKVEQLEKGHWLVYEFEAIRKDTMAQYIKSLESDSVQVELRGEMLIAKQLKSNTSNLKNTFSLEGDFYHSPKKPFMEININKAIAIDNFSNIKEESLQILKKDDAYFLNIKKDDGWYLIWFDSNSDTISLNTSHIVSDDFNEKFVKSSNLFPIKKLNNNPTYGANPSDTEFFKFIKDNKVFYKTKWTKINQKQDHLKEECQLSNWKWLFGGIILFLAIIIGFIKRKSV